MTKILITAGTCGEGPGSYEMGVFSLPDGRMRGVEDLVDLASSDVSESVARRTGIARGLREALAATGPLPRPLGLAASVLGVGLDVLGGDGRCGLTVEVRFADGARASIRADAEAAAQMVRDREVLQLAALRRARPSLPAPLPEPSADLSASELSASDVPLPGMSAPDAPALASIFTYEKRGGRLRRLATKARDDA